MVYSDTIPLTLYCIWRIFRLWFLFVLSHVHLQIIFASLKFLSTRFVLETKNLSIVEIQHWRCGEDEGGKNKTYTDPNAFNLLIKSYFNGNIIIIYSTF